MVLEKGEIVEMGSPEELINARGAYYQMLQAQTPPEDQWQFGVTLPLWAPSIDGNVTVGGMKQDISVSFDKLKDHLDAAFSLGLDAHKGRFGLFASGGYMKFSGDFSGPGSGDASSTLKLGIVNAGLSYVLVKTEGKHPFMLAETVGLRYWYLSEDLKVTGPGPLNPVLVDGSVHKDLFDPVIGLQASQYITPKFHLDVMGDVGGFNISYETDMTWSVAGMATYDFTKRFSLSAGYAALSLDVKTGGGASQHGFDLIFHGPQIAAKLTF